MDTKAHLLLKYLYQIHPTNIKIVKSPACTISSLSMHKEMTNGYINLNPSLICVRDLNLSKEVPSNGPKMQFNLLHLIGQVIEKGY